jgi:hypothetical protein
MSKMEGAQISTPPENNTYCPNKSKIMIFKPSNMFHYLAKRQELDKKWVIFFYETNVHFNILQHSTFIKVVKATSKF